MGLSFVRVVCWISFLQYCLTAAKRGGSKPQRYCVETTVKGIELKDFLAECDYEGIPQPVTDLNKKVDDKTVHMLEKAINFDVIQAFHSYKACRKYISSRVRCIRKPTERDKEVKAIISIETSIPRSDLKSLLEMTTTPNFCRLLTCYGFVKPTVFKVSMASMPKRYCMSAVLTDVPFDKSFMPDEKRSKMWNIGFRKSVQHDVLRMMIEIGMCDRYQYSKVRCFRNEADLTKVWLEVGAIATLEQMQKVTSALQNGVAKMGPYYAFSQVSIWQEPSKACDVC